jgi:hypothetical protein
MGETSAVDAKTSPVRVEQAHADADRGTRFALPQPCYSRACGCGRGWLAHGQPRPPKRRLPIAWATTHRVVAIAPWLATNRIVRADDCGINLQDW